jgi:hypothetical protein
LDTIEAELPENVFFRINIVHASPREDALILQRLPFVTSTFFIHSSISMGLTLNQPCFIETTDRDILIAQARVVEISEDGGALQCESGEQFSAVLQPAVLVAISGHRLKRIAVTITRKDSGVPTVTFSRV